jgi:AcrR family transcriptional regulator
MARGKTRRGAYKRADHPEQKDERRQLILRAAAEELAHVGSAQDFTIDVLARRAGLAKGTVYLYFENKSAILMALLGSAVENLLTNVSTRLVKLPEPVNAKKVARAIRDSLKSSAMSRRLARLLKSLSDKDSRRSRQKFQQRIEPLMERVDAIIVGRMHGLRRGDGHQIMRYAWALLLGLTEMAQTSPKIKSCSGKPRKATPVKVDQSLEEALTLLIEGYLAHSR